MQGKDRLIVRCVAEDLGLEGSYTPRTYIEQIQLEKLVNEVMVLSVLSSFFLPLSYSLLSLSLFNSLSKMTK